MSNKKSLPRDHPDEEEKVGLLGAPDGIPKTSGGMDCNNSSLYRPSQGFGKQHPLLIRRSSPTTSRYRHQIGSWIRREEPDSFGYGSIVTPHFLR